jgi:nucleotide-binding universal stress UspA family protein
MRQRVLLRLQADYAVRTLFCCQGSADTEFLKGREVLSLAKLAREFSSHPRHDEEQQCAIDFRESPARIIKEARVETSNSADLLVLGTRRQIWRWSISFGLSVLSEIMKTNN